MVRPGPDPHPGLPHRPGAVGATVHGHDIATGTGRPWPISAEHAKLILGTVCPKMWPLVVRPEAGRGAPVTYEIRLRGNGPRYVVRVADGTAEVRAAGGPVDCVISADPVTFCWSATGGCRSAGRCCAAGCWRGAAARGSACVSRTCSLIRDAAARPGARRTGRRSHRPEPGRRRAAAGSAPCRTGRRRLRRQEPGIRFGIWVRCARIAAILCAA